MENKDRVDHVGAHHTGAPHKRDRIWITAGRGDIFSHSEHDRTGRGEQFEAFSKEEACAPCREFFGKFQCGKSVHLECDCPRCLGYCECVDLEIPSSTGAGDHSGEARNEDGGTCREQLPTLRQGDGEDGSNRTLSTSKGEGEEMADADADSERGRSRETRSEDAEDARESPGSPRRLLWWSTESRLGRVVDVLADRLVEPGADDDGNIPRVAIGIPQRVARLKAIGNGQVSVCAALAWKILTEGSEKR